MNTHDQDRDGELAIPSIIADYQLHPGIPDEMIDAEGNVRPGWSALMAAFDKLGPGELGARFERANQYLRDAGVFYRTYEGTESHERAWPLAHVPLLVDEADWARISTGLIQRVELLETVVADIYGDNNLVQQGLLPPELIAQNNEFLRPLVGIKPTSGHYLHFCAFELGRGPDGAWWVLGDRTQAPSGAGFALENRVATTHALSDIYADMNVQRLAGFFRDFRDMLFADAKRDGGWVGILTPGQLNETYFEHAYIARYLGLMLLEGEDLIVQDGKVMVRTVAGLMPVSALWRRMDAAFVDPLELRYDSRIGTPGMVDALRHGSISMINALGTGLLETRALAAFMPRLARKLLGEPLALPEIATWWCGQPAEQQHVIDNFDDLMIGPAFATTLPFDDLVGTKLGSTMAPDEKARAIESIRNNGTGFVGQEQVQLSTAPVYVNGKLQPRPITLRVYAARTRDGWSIMPGGFARVGSSHDTSAIAMQRGGQAADVWVLSSQPVEHVSLLPNNGKTLVRSTVGDLPSRAADNLIWLGRYAERCEATLRILRAYHARLGELSSADLPILTHCADFLDTIDVDAAEPMPRGLLASINSAVRSAGQIRDRFSPDGWLALADLQKTAQRFGTRVSSGDDSTHAMTVLLRKLAGFSGLVHENMYRFAGWRFLELGRRLERAIQITRIAAWLTREDAPNGSVEMLLEIGDSVMSHRRRYSVSAGAQSVVDLLILDPLNPRSAIFQLAELRAQIEMLPGGVVDGQLSPSAKAALAIETELRIADATDMVPERLDKLAGDIVTLSGLIAAAYLV